MYSRPVHCPTKISTHINLRDLSVQSPRLLIFGFHLIYCLLMSIIHIYVSIYIYITIVHTNHVQCLICLLLVKHLVRMVKTDQTKVLTHVLYAHYTITSWLNHVRSSFLMGNISTMCSPIQPVNAVV